MTNSSLFKIFRKQGGFTMVELAIVLVIAGIILTAVLKGTDMINKAKIERITSDLKGLQGMVLEHEKRTGRLPGDCDENGIIGFTAFTANALDNNQYVYTIDPDPDAARCTAPDDNENSDANFVWSELRKANIVDPTRTNINLTKHTLSDFYAVGSIAAETTTGAEVNVIVAHGLPLWLAKGVDVAIDGAQGVGQELAGGGRGRIRLYATEAGDVTQDGAEWPEDVEGGDYQFVAITYQFDTRMAQPAVAGP